MAANFSRKDAQSALAALVTQFNLLHDVVMSGTYVHRDQSGVSSGSFPYQSSSLLQVTAPAATNLATAIALTNDLRGVMMNHFADDRAHKQADKYGASGVSMVNGSTFITASSDQNSCWSTLNFLSGALQSHFSSSIHSNSDLQVLSGVLTNDISSVKTFANALKTELNAHIFSGPLVGGIKLID